MSDLDSILKGTAPKAEAAPAVEAPVVEQAAAETPERARDESGRFVPKGEDHKPEAAKVDAAPPAAKEIKPKAPEVSGLEAGIAAERQKRQDAERRYAEMEARFKAVEQRINPPPPPPDPIANPREFTQGIEQRFQEMAINHRVDTSVAVARVKHADFDEVMQGFGQMPPQEAEALYFQAIQSPDPALHVYRAVKRGQMLREIGDDPAAYRERVAAEIRQQLESEFAQRAPAIPAVTPPPSLAGARSNGRMSEPVWSGPPPLTSIFKR